MFFLKCFYQLYDTVIRWWVLCALEPNCISPTRDLGCRFNGRDHYANCHRFDQSALGILLSNYFENDTSKYSAKDGVLDVMRGSENVELLRVCPADGPVATIKSRQYF
jgi:hypothetical protein